MFKRYARHLLDKEVAPAPAPDYVLRRPSPFASDLATPYLGELEEEDVVHNDERPETILGEEVTIKGTLTFQNCLRIDGSFEGELISDGKLIVGPKGVVKAHLNLQEAFISGKVEGDITVKERLVLRGRAEIRGNITAPLLSVDEGVSIIGQLNVVMAQKPEPEAVEPEAPLNLNETLP